MFQEIDQLNDEIWLNGTNDPGNSLTKAEEALRLSEAADYPLGRAESLLNTGRCRIFLSESAEAKKKLSEALSIFRQLEGERSQTGELRSLNALGVASFELQEYENALNYYFMALTESETNRNDEIRILALNNIGEAHRFLNNSEEALSYYHRALNLAEANASERNIGTTEINLGEIYFALNDLSEAETHFSNAMRIAEKNNVVQMRADAMFGKAKILLKLTEPTGLALLKEARELYEQLGDRICIYESIYQAGLYNISEKNYAAAEEDILTAKTGAVELGQKELECRCILKLSELSKYRKDYRTALDYYIEYNNLKAGFVNENIRNRLRKITILYETEQTETEKEAYRMQSLSLERSNKEIKFINEIGRHITSSLNLDEIIDRTFSRLSEILEISSFGVAVFDESTGEIIFSNIVEEGIKQRPVHISIHDSCSLAAWCIRNGASVRINEREEALNYIEEWKTGTASPSESAIFMPMEQRGRMIGCMSIQHSRKNAYTESDLDTIGAVSTFLAIALDNSRAHAEVNKLNEMISNEKQGLEVAYQKIAHMANHDSLTDLPNRHLLHELVERGIKLAERSGSKLAVLYMDLDNFKPVNDTLGHESGDEVLRIVADRLTRALRTSDTVARIGGDEFVAVLNNISSEDGINAAAKKIINSIGRNIDIMNKTFNLGVSIGVSVFPDNDKTMAGLLLKADQAMYKAKQAGKNQTWFYGTE